MGKARNIADLLNSSGKIDSADIDSSAQFYQFKNRIINGAMMIDQRNAGASVSPLDTYTLDRWQGYASVASKYTVQQNAGSVTPPVGFTNYLGVTSSSAYSVGASERFAISQKIEGLNCADLAWGTANAQPVTLSFWVRSSLTGTFGGVFTNSAYNRSYPYTYTINAANTWEQKTITVAGDTTGTWLTTNGVCLQIWFSLGAGSSVSGTAGSWSGSTFLSATGATSVVGTSGATFYITGVQLEKGSTATSFDYRPYGTELQLCQRYFQRFSSPTQYTALAQGISVSATASSSYIKFMNTMRAAPTVSFNDLMISDNSSYALAITAGTMSIQAGNDSARLSCTNTSGATSQRPASMLTNSASSYLDLASEL